jgi:hypothetical protein
MPDFTYIVKYVWEVCIEFIYVFKIKYSCHCFDSYETVSQIFLGISCFEFYLHLTKMYNMPSTALFLTKFIPADIITSSC